MREIRKYREFYTCKRCGYVFHDICLSCQKVLSETNITCPNCQDTGRREKKRYLICPECGIAIAKEDDIKDTDNKLLGQKYCTNCGYKVSDLIKEELEKNRQPLNMADIQ